MRENRGKLIILGVLIVTLAIAGLLLSRQANKSGKPIANTSFSLMTSIHELTTPLGVAVDGDENIYVSNTGASEFVVYDSGGVEKFRLTSIPDDKADGLDENGDVKFYSPYGIAVDDENNKVYICDAVVRVLDKAGNYLYSLKLPPGTVAVTPGQGSPRTNEITLYKDKVFVTSRDGIYIFDNQGKYIGHWGTRGAEIGQYDFPNGIAADPANGNLFIADTNNSRVVSLTPEGKTRWVIGAWDDAKIGNPFHLVRSVAVGPDGLVYVSDVPDRILVLDQDGNLKAIIGERGTEDAQLNFPEGIAVSSSNKLYIADRENNRVQVWQLSGDMPLPSAADVEKFKKSLRKFE
ncbi:MAG: NHL repeat-containing protein [Actinomycetota bacterium]